MAKFFKSTKGKIITIVLALVLIVGGIGGYFIFRKDKQLVFDYEKGAIANARVESAQYTPDMDKFIENNSPEVLAAQSLNTSFNSSVILASTPETQLRTSGTNMSIEEFSELVDEYGTILNYAGAGKYLGYDIYEIKNEISYITKNVPAFNQWFRMPFMREEQGYVSTPYYEFWAYYLEMDKNERLSITRVCWSTRSQYLDFETGEVVEYYEDGTKFVQYEIMKTNYYTDTNGDEVVECFIYSVGVDNVKNGGICNTNTEDYHPFEYQYLKNVKDKSLIKYHITAAERYRDDEVSDLGFEDGGMDIRGLTPYGSRREFTIINYDGYVNIDLTKIDQKFATLDNPTADGSVNFDIESANIQNLVENIGLSEEAYVSTDSAYDLMDKIAKQIIDNFEIKNNWANIYKDSTDAIVIDFIKGQFYDKDILISDVSVYVSCRDWDKSGIEFDCSADVYDMSKFDVNKEYSLSMALRNRETGNLYIVATDYNLLEEVYYDDSTTDTYLKQTNLDLDSSVINIEEDGVYDITCVLTVKENNEDVVLFDTLEIAYLRQFCGLIIPNSIDSNDVEHAYFVQSTGGKIVITVSSVNS